MNDLGLFVEGQRILVNSTVVAKNYNKEPAKVTRAIKDIIEAVPEARANFGETSYLDSQGRQQPCYIMDRQGFSMLVMGFTGTEAKRFTYKYTLSFEKMLRELQGAEKTSRSADKLHIQEMNAKARLEYAKIKKADMLMKLSNVETLSSEYKNILVNKATETLTGMPLLPMKESEEKTYTATELAKMFNVSAQKIGRIANTYELKTPEYGEWYRDKSPYSSKEVDSFRYYETVIPKLRNILESA